MDTQRALSQTQTQKGHKGWKQGWRTWEKYSSTLSEHPGMRLGKPKPKRNSVWAGLSKITGSPIHTQVTKGIQKENVDPLLGSMEYLVTQDIEKGDILNARLALRDPRS